MNSNQRGPVIVFAVLFGAIFLCLCLVVAGVGLNRVSNSIAVSPRNFPPAQLVATPEQAVQAGQAANPAPIVAPVTITIDPSADVEPQILRAVYQKANPSVVKIVVLGGPSTDTQTQPDELIPQGQGSGFIWDPAGYIATNAHVVEGASEVQVIFSDDRSVPGEVLGADPNSDIAVVEIDPTGFNLVPVERGNIDDIQVGDRAIAIGAPFDFAGSMTVGTVSGLGRSIRSLNARYTIPEVIQTDAPINPGNSGGPLLDSRGEVIGINAQIRNADGVRANSGVGFAIPIYIAERVVPALIESGRYEHPFLGVSGQTYTPAWAEALGFPPDIRGAYVSEALPGQPAARAGIRGASENTDVVTGFDFTTGDPVYLQSGGDLITGINNQPVNRFDDLLIYLFRYAAPGDTVQLSVIRADGSQVVIPVELGVRPAQ